MKKAMKIWIGEDPELMKAVQLELFRRGYRWKSADFGFGGPTRVDYLDEGCLFADANGTITKCDADSEYFAKQDYPEVSASFLLASSKDYAGEPPQVPKENPKDKPKSAFDSLICDVDKLDEESFKSLVEVVKDRCLREIIADISGGRHVS